MATVTSRPPGLRGYDARWSDSTGTALVTPDGLSVTILTPGDLPRTDAVVDFGAPKDNSGDAAAAINNALAAAGVSEVWLPDGIYQLRSTLLIPHRKRLSMSKGAKLVPHASGVYTNAALVSPSGHSASIRGGQIDGTGSTGLTGIYGVDSHYYFFVEDIDIRYVDTAVDFRSHSCSLKGSILSYCDTGLCNKGEHANGNVIHDNRIESMRVGVEIDNGSAATNVDGIFLTSNLIQLCTESSVLIKPSGTTMFHVFVSGNYFESWTHGMRHIWIIAADGGFSYQSIIDNTFFGLAASGEDTLETIDQFAIYQEVVGGMTQIGGNMFANLRKGIVLGSYGANNDRGGNVFYNVNKHVESNGRVIGGLTGAYSAAEIADATHLVNTQKWEGRGIWNNTAKIPMWAGDNGAYAPWIGFSGAAHVTITPA